jgi:hypothetical protein
MHFIGMKHQRLHFWIVILEKAGQKLKSEKKLAKASDFEILKTQHYLPFQRELEFEASISLDDVSTIKSEIRGGKERLEMLIGLNADIAGFIRTHCEYADMFP